MKNLDANIVWFAGIIDGEGCFSVKRPVKRGRGRTCHQVWLVLCNTNQNMVIRAANTIESLGCKRPAIRRVWKGAKATRWQYWLNIGDKYDLLRVTEALLPHLTAKSDEAEAVAWFLRRACTAKAYKRTELDIAVLESLSAVKRNGGEVPAESVLREIIPSLAVADNAPTEGVETRSVSSNNNPIQEPPATSIEVDDIVRSLGESQGDDINNRRVVTKFLS